MKIKIGVDGSDRLGFFCPGCNGLHWFRAKSEKNPDGWVFDGNMECPTVSSSILVTWGDSVPPGRRCHLYLVGGQLKFLGDCSHAFAGQTMPLPDIPEKFL
jgi:hypothetical protein